MSTLKLPICAIGIRWIETGSVRDPESAATQPDAMLGTATAD
jgi:hypothetical protein